MDANTRKLERIFDQTITYQVPLFQRPYVWTRESNWEPLWEDIQVLMDKALCGERLHPHFLGAVVLEQVANTTGSIESRQVIDGQQRFTTLQLFLIAARDQANEYAKVKYIDRFNDLVVNKRSKIDHDEEVYKVWPTNSNRAAFALVHSAGSLENLNQQLRDHLTLNSTTNNIIEGYQYFYKQLANWLQGHLDEDDYKTLLLNKNLDERFEALWLVVKDYLQLVVIDLDKNDEAQVIFETLNARGEDLLPADLIKNFLFRRALNQGENVEKLYANYWQDFEATWWRQEVTQGRLKRPRIDLFINHYLIMMVREDIKTSHLFNMFRNFYEQSNTISANLIRIPHSASEHIIQLARYAKIYKVFHEPVNHPRLATFLKYLETIDTLTVYPILLYAYSILMPNQQEEFDNIIGWVESYLVRRMICGLSTKSYNRYFSDFIRVIDRQQVLTAQAVIEYMAKSQADTGRFPDNNSIDIALTYKFYERLPQYKVRTILEALNDYQYSNKTGKQLLQVGLTIEHIMPQKWQLHWPLAPELKLDTIKEQEAIQKRNRLVHSLGNLTLITDVLNPKLSNAAWLEKRPELLKYSLINLTRYFHDDECKIWDETNIEKRTAYLGIQIKTIWPPLPNLASDKSD